jgi:glutamine---fructose-6-phosphate transaminase (isomerizing)
VSRGELSAADIAEQPDVLGSVLSHNEAGLTRARDIVGEARVVRFLALGSSKHAAGYGAHALDVLGGVPSVVLPAPGAAVTLPLPRPDEPLVVLSQSGRTPALLEVVGRAREAGVDVIAVTNQPGSALEDAAAVTLACAAGAERVVAATKSVTAQAVLLRALASPLDAAPLVAAVAAAVELDVTHVGRRTASTVVCAGFAGEWIADEVALKFAEMAGLSMTSESVVEHFHGPRAANVSALAFLDPSDPNSRALATDPSASTVGPDARFDLVTPTTGEPSLDAIVTLVIGQRLAHAWALAHGGDPDASRGLSKVTETR